MTPDPPPAIVVAATAPGRLLLIVIGGDSAGWGQRWSRSRSPPHRRQWCRPRSLRRPLPVPSHLLVGDGTAQGHRAGHRRLHPLPAARRRGEERRGEEEREKRGGGENNTIKRGEEEREERRLKNLKQLRGKRERRGEKICGGEGYFRMRNT